MSKKLYQRGFTLIELLVVIAIIGILSGVVVTSLNSGRIKARDARRISDLQQLQLALTSYYDTNQTYPPDLLTLKTSGLIPAVPVDPSTGTSANYLYNPYSSATWALGDAVLAACTGAAPCSGYHMGISVEGAAPATSAAVYPTAASATILKSATSNATKCNAADTGPAVNCYDVRN